MVRDLALEQGLLAPDAQITRQLQYSFLGRPVCLVGCCTLLGIGRHPRLHRIYTSVLSGARSAPADMRYIARPPSRPSPQCGEIHSYLQSLYESVVETMPHDDLKAEDDRSLPAVGDEYNGLEPALPAISDVPSVSATFSDRSNADLRFLPPGSIYEQWRQYTEAVQKVGFKLFWRVWVQHYSKLLAFRPHMMHSVCAVCVKHRLLLRELSHDIRARVKQRMLYDRHLAMQFADRQSYWSLRASSRLRSKIVCMIVDGMDQSKFAWPR
jgi:hypothetical protein